MSSRSLYSRPRPRTRIYDSNYNIGENYYKSAIDRLDRKYSGRPAVSPPRHTSTLPEDLLERHERAFADDDLPSARRRAGKVISEETLFDSRGQKTARGKSLSAALDEMDIDFDEETAAALKRIRAIKQQNQLHRAEVDDIDMESTHSNLKSRRILERADQMLDSVGITDSSRRALDETVKRRSIRMAQQEEDSSENAASSNQIAKWTKMDQIDSGSSLMSEDRSNAAAIRARKTRARLNDLQEEMDAMDEKRAQRERRVAHLKQFMADNMEDDTAVKSIRVSARSEKKTVTF